MPSSVGTTAHVGGQLLLSYGGSQCSTMLLLPPHAAPICALHQQVINWQGRKQPHVIAAEAGVMAAGVEAHGVFAIVAHTFYAGAKCDQITCSSFVHLIDACAGADG
jgi:hypothetical protein